MTDADARALAKLYVIHAKANAMCTRWENEAMNARRAIDQFERKFAMEGADAWPVIFSDEEERFKKETK